MTLRDASGNVLNKTELTALAPQVAVTPPRRFTANVYETYPLSGEGSRFESGKRLKFRAGQTISQADFDNLFPLADVTSVTPASGPAAGGTAITIKGVNLSGVEGVTIGGVAATNVKVVDNNTVTCNTGPHAAGAVPVVLADDSGAITEAGGFTYTA